MARTKIRLLSLLLMVCVVAVVLLPVLQFVPTVNAAWLSGWARRIKLTIDAGDIDADLTNFPVLIYLGTSAGINAEDISCVFDELTSDNNRLKIAVTTSDEVTECYVEVDKWNDISEQAWLWVNVPSISGTVDTDLYLYYDSTHANNTAYVGDTGSVPAKAVWDVSFQMVQHMRDNSTSTTLDSIKTYNGTKGAANQPIVTTSGKIDDAQNFSIPNNITYTDIQPTSITLEAWINTDTQGANGWIVMSCSATNGRYGYLFGSPWATGKTKAMISRVSSIGSYTSAICTTTLSNSTWYHITGTFDGANLRMYVNGTLETTTASSAFDYSGTQKSYIGQGTETGYTIPFDGVIDECRTSNTTRSDAWIKACYETERDNLLDWSSEEGNMVSSVHTCPLDQRTFVIAYHDAANEHFTFQIYDTNGTQILAETDVDTTSGGNMGYTSIGVSAFNSTTFVIGWYDKADGDATFAVYNTAGTLLSGPTDADTNIGAGSYSVQVACFNSTYFVIGWYDYTDQDVTFAVYDSGGNVKTVATDVDTAVAYSNSVSVSTFDSTTFVIGWFDDDSDDATFAVYDSAGTLLAGPTDADTNIGSSKSVSVTTLNSTYFVIGWYVAIGYDATFAVYNSTGTLKTGPTDADEYAGDAGTGCQSVQVSALNSTAFVISWYDASSSDYDLSFATYLSDGTAVAALTDIESWPTNPTDPFRSQSPCSQETGTGIELYGGNWIIAYGNTTAQATPAWKAFKPDGTAWDGSTNNAPTIGAASGTNWDDTDNCYAQKKTYTVSVTYSDADGFANIHYCELYLKTGGNTTRAEFQFHEDDASWSTPAGSTEWTLTGQSNASSGTDIAVVWGFQAQWDATEESNLDFLFFVVDATGASVNSVSDENFDVVTRLVTSGFTSDDDRINLAGTTTISGTVYYANDPGSNTASASYPPDAEFTSVSIHDSAHAVQATDVTIVNGAFSTSFAIPNAVQSNTYHVYINLADADGTDQDALDVDTTPVVGDRFKVNAATLAFEDPDGRVNVGTAGIFSCTAESEYDGHVLVAGDSLVLTGYIFSYNGTYWVNSTAQAAPTSVTINSLTSLSEATFGITAGNINANSANGRWDRIRIDSLACADTRIDVSTEGLFYCTASLETDGHTLGAADSLTLTGHVFSWNVTSVRFEYKETNASVTNTTIDSFTSGNEATYGITVGNINSMTTTEVWDRYKLDAASLTFSDLDGRANVGIVEVFSCTAQSEYDGHVLGGVGDTLVLSGHAFSYNGTYWVYSTSLAAPADLTINALTSVYEATYGIGAGNINGNSAVGIWDNLTVTNIQPVQYLGSGDYKYEAQLKYGYDLVAISGGYAVLAYPNGTVVGKVSSNATGWATFVVGQLNSTSGVFNLYGENETAYAITYPGANQTFTIYLWTLAPQDVSGNSLTTTILTVSDGATTVWTGTAVALYVPAATFNVSIAWLQNLPVNSTLNVNIAADTTTDFNCTCYPYVIGATRYWTASNATITSSVYAGSLLTVQFSCVNDSYVLVASYTTCPAYVLNVTYDYTTAFAPGYLVIPHFGNVTIVASYENWGGLYVEKTDRTMWSVGWAGQKLSIVLNGTVGDAGEIDVYCASRGSPVTTSGFTVTSYVGGVFIGLYAFTAADATVSLEWAFPVGPGPGPGPIQAASLFITLTFSFPETVQSGATVNGSLNVSWLGAAKFYIWSVVVDSNYAEDWKLQITRLPWTLETLSQNGRAQVPVILYITGALAAGNYSVPCDVTFNTVEGVSKTVRSILTFEVVTPIAQVPSTLVYVFLIGICLVVTSGLFLGTEKRRKYSQ